MPRPLKKTPPSSSVARLFDGEAALRALEPVSETAPPITSLTAVIQESVTWSQEGQQPAPAMNAPTQGPVRMTAPGTTRGVAAPSFQAANPTAEPTHKKREIQFSTSTDATFSRLIETYRRATGTRITASHVARAMLTGIAQCMDSVEYQAQQIGRLKLPSNARGREQEREKFEEAIAEAFINGIRSAAAYRRTSQ